MTSIASQRFFVSFNGIRLVIQMKKTLFIALTWLGFALSLSFSSIVSAQQQAAIIDKPVAAKFFPKSTHARFMSIASNENTLLAVGERGIIVRSTDKGATWTQMASPVDITLASVTFETPKRVWAVGQAASILRSDDAGLTWKLLRYKPSDLRYYLKINIHEGVIHVAGSDGELWESRDDGAHWEMATLENGDSSPHLFSIAYVGKTSLMSAERGSVFMRSESDTAWKIVPTLYNGSFFGVISFADQFLLFGMSGKAFLLSPDGVKQIALETQTTQFLLDAAVLPEKNKAILVGRGGVILLINSDGQVLGRQQRPDNADITSVAVQGDDVFFTTMKGGVERVKVGSLMQGNAQLSTPNGSAK